MDGVPAAGRPSRVRTRRRRLRSHKLATLLVALIVLVGVGGASDLGYVSVKSRADELQARLTLDLQAGQAELESGKTALQDANSKHDSALVTQAINHFTAAKTDFLSASQTADDSRFLRYLQYVPAVGHLATSRHAAVDGIAQMGAYLATAGQNVANLDEELIKPTSSGDAGRTLLTVLNVVNGGLGEIRSDLQSAREAASQVDVQVLPAGQQAAFLKARAAIDSALSGFSEFQRLVPVLTEVLGGNGARRYLVEQVNPAELRAGGGFIGTYSLIQADQGSLKVLQSGDSYALADPRPLPSQPGFIPQPTPYREIIPDISWSFVDSNIYPDFPSNALAAERFVEPRIGHIDGVISMDYFTVAKMLDLTGPMTVPGYGFAVDSSTFVYQAMQHDIAGDATHKAILTALAGPLMQRITSLTPDKWPTVLATFNDLAAQRHLQAFLNDQTVESELDRIGWSGKLHDSNSDFAMEVESNYYGTKSNYFVNRHFSLDLVRVGNVLRHEVAIDLVNNEPCGIEDRTLYKSNIRLYVSGNAFSLSDNLQPVTYPNPPAPAGTKLLDGWLFVNCGGGRGQAIFDYDTPIDMSLKSEFEIYWQKQPGTEADPAQVTWTALNGRTYRGSGVMSRDQLIVLRPGALTVTDAGSIQAALPSLTLG